MGLELEVGETSEVWLEFGELHWQVPELKDTDTGDF